ncbi:MAG TPA: methyltransferase [Myxococcota bacterium]|jgi:hypothetical protein
MPPPSPSSRAPSHSIAGLNPAPFPSAPPALVVKAALGLRSLLRRAADAIVPPFLVGVDLSAGVAWTAMVGAVARAGIADALRDGPLSAAEIAARTHTNADVVHRTLRALATRNVFKIERDGRFALTRISRALLTGDLARGREWCDYFSSRANALAWIDYDECLRSGASAFQRVHGVSVWDWFDAHPAERECFAQCMMGATVVAAPVVASIYPWHEVNVLCDVGGGRGTLLSEILVRHPHLRGVLVDGAGVIESAQALLAARGVLARVQCKPGSFFSDVPSGADTYSLKNVLHDWDDARCIQILEVVKRALPPGGRILVIETLVEHNDLSLGAFADVQMLVVSDGGRERGRGELSALFAHSGLSMGRVFDAGTVAVIEAFPRGAAPPR